MDKRITPHELVAYFAGLIDGKHRVILADDTLSTMREVAAALFFAGQEDARAEARGAQAAQARAATPMNDAAYDIPLCTCEACAEWDDMDEDDDWMDEDDDDWEECPCCVKDF